MRNRGKRDIFFDSKSTMSFPTKIILILCLRANTIDLNCG